MGFGEDTMQYFFFFVFIIFWLCQLICVFSVPALDSLPQGPLVPCIREEYLETKFWVLGELIATEVSLLLGPLSRPS